jgi:hypothetical protein
LSHFAPAQLLNAIKYIEIIFNLQTVKEPYVVACVNVIADSDKEAARLILSRDYS